MSRNKHLGFIQGNAGHCYYCVKIINVYHGFLLYFRKAIKLLPSSENESISFHETEFVL